MCVVWEFVRNFVKDEFLCACCGKEMMDYRFMTRLSAARSMAGVPFTIHSGWRCEEHDRKVGGKGEHTLGACADIACTDSSSRFIIVDNLIIAGFRRIGIAHTFIHAGEVLDEVDGYPRDRIWLYEVRK